MSLQALEWVRAVVGVEDKVDPDRMLALQPAFVYSVCFCKSIK